MGDVLGVVLLALAVGAAIYGFAVLRVWVRTGRKPGQPLSTTCDVCGGAKKKCPACGGRRVG